jgi:hypothetical protein
VVVTDGRSVHKEESKIGLIFALREWFGEKEHLHGLASALRDLKKILDIYRSQTLWRIMALHNQRIIYNKRTEFLYM